MRLNGRYIVAVDGDDRPRQRSDTTGMADDQQSNRIRRKRLKVAPSGSKTSNERTMKRRFRQRQLLGRPDQRLAIWAFSRRWHVANRRVDTWLASEEGNLWVQRPPSASEVCRRRYRTQLLKLHPNQMASSSLFLRWKVVKGGKHIIRAVSFQF